jgi:hypothetical protein
VPRELLRRGNRVFPMPGQLRRPWHLLFAEFFDWKRPAAVQTPPALQML